MAPQTRSNATRVSIEPFDEDLDRAFQGVRGAFTNLLASVQADPTRPQDLARRFGLNKNLAWRVSKLVTVTDPHAVISNLPGPASVGSFLRALEANGAPAEAISAAKEALERFDDMVELHVGDRSTLQLVLSSNAPHKVPQEHLHATRKMAFQGNSSIWGIQARVRLASFFIAPNPDDPTWIDTASMGGLLDVRRLRADASVPLFLRFAYNDDGTERSGPSPEPVDSNGSPDNPLMLIHEFCSTPVPSFDPIAGPGYTRYQLSPGPIGNRGLNSWVFGEVSRRFAPIYRDEFNTFGEHAVPIQMPVEWLLVDIQIHKDLDFAQDPRVIAYSRLASGPSAAGEAECDRLPLAEQVESIGHEPPIVATPLVPQYQSMVQRVYERMGWSGRDFHGYRFTMKFPPMPTSIVLQHDLAEPEG